MVNLLDPNVIITRMYESGKFSDMLNYCSKLLEKNPNDLMALQNSALSLLNMENYSEAITYCDKVLQENNFDNYALSIKIQSLENLKKYEEVLICCESIFAKNKEDVWALNTSGMALNELNRFSEAIEFYDKALKIEDKNITSLMNKAISLSFLGENQKSIENYDMAQLIDPSMKELAIAKSREFEKLDLKDEAFLAAQGVLLKDMEKIKSNAKKNKCSVFHQFCQTEFEEKKQKQPN
jgi:tetratricopeptide (TPR) repeat protein